MNSFTGKLFSVVKLYRFGIFRLIFNRLFSVIFRYKTIIVYNFDLNKKDSGISFPKESVTFKKIGRSQKDLFEKFHEKYSSPGFVSRIQRDDKDLYVALHGGEIVAYAWITYKEFFIDELNYAYPLKDDEFFIFDCFVSREYRGKGIYPAMLRKILKDYSSEHSYKLAYIGVSSANRGSVRGIGKAGFKEYNRIRYVKWLNKEKWWGVEDCSVTAKAPQPNYTSLSARERDIAR